MIDSCSGLPSGTQSEREEEEEEKRARRASEGGERFFSSSSSVFAAPFSGVLLPLTRDNFRVPPQPRPLSNEKTRKGARGADSGLHTLGTTNENVKTPIKTNQVFLDKQG